MLLKWEEVLINEGFRVASIVKAPAQSIRINNHHDLNCHFRAREKSHILHFILLKQE